MLVSKVYFGFTNVSTKAISENRCHRKEKLFCVEAGRRKLSEEQIECATSVVPSGTKQYRAAVPSKEVT
ncbi:hypothetical protein KFK09_025235 [Dendrobium nobile]|uniref:Uncharacterized protein n=1 Tax=Dendrobium nobile TaxID=94219 RepID=A0A8T3AG08_DENNO|nr:hypothetical protein KFK09_025235 [Dendrobium nobile]